MKRERNTLKADAFFKIEELLGRKEAAGELGISPSNWSPSNVKEGQVSSTVELAARHVLSKLEGEEKAPRTIVVTCSADKVAILCIFLEGLGAGFVNLTTAASGVGRQV